MIPSPLLPASGSPDATVALAPGTMPLPSVPATTADSFDRIMERTLSDCTTAVGSERGQVKGSTMIGPETKSLPKVQASQLGAGESPSPKRLTQAVTQAFAGKVSTPKSKLDNEITTVASDDSTASQQKLGTIPTESNESVSIAVAAPNLALVVAPTIIPSMILPETGSASPGLIIARDAEQPVSAVDPLRSQAANDLGSQSVPLVPLQARPDSTPPPIIQQPGRGSVPLDGTPMPQDALPVTSRQDDGTPTPTPSPANSAQPPYPLTPEQRPAQPDVRAILSGEPPVVLEQDEAAPVSSATLAHTGQLPRLAMADLGTTPLAVSEASQAVPQSGTEQEAMAPATSTAPAHLSEATSREISDSARPPFFGPRLLHGQETRAAAGTVSAKYVTRMSNVEQTDTNEAIAKQSLPQTPATLPAAADSARPVLTSQATASSNHHDSVAGPIQISEGVYITPERTGRADIAVADSGTETIVTTHAGTLEQIQHKLSNCAVELKRLQADEMLVVLKPDRHTEVALQLSLKDGVVEIAAQFKRGDFSGLNAMWGQLQQTLSAQGVRLGGLQEPVSNNSLGSALSQGFSQPRHDPPARPEPLEHHARGPIFSRASVTTPLKTSVPALTTPRAWESWA